MTKMKSKKMTKSTFAVIVMAIAMVAMLAFGGTFAYFTANTVPVSNTTTTGLVKIGHGVIADFHSEKLVPGDTVASGVSFYNYSDVETFAVVKFTVTFNGTEAPNGVLSYTLDAGWTELTVGQAEGSASTAVIYLYQILPAYASQQNEYDVVNVCGAISFAGVSNMAETYTPGTPAVGEQGDDDYVAEVPASWTYAETNAYGVDVMAKNVVVTFQAWAIQSRNISDVTGTIDTDAERITAINAACSQAHVAYVAPQEPEQNP